MSVEENIALKDSFVSGARIGRHLFERVYRFLYHVTRGVIGSQYPGSRRDVLLLTTIGSKSGKQRSVLLFYLVDGNHFIVVASNRGAADHPSWWWNLRANPNAQIQLRQR